MGIMKVRTLSLILCLLVIMIFSSCTTSQINTPSETTNVESTTADTSSDIKEILPKHQVKLATDFDKYLDESDISSMNYRYQNKIYGSHNRTDAKQQIEFELGGANYSLQYKHSFYYYDRDLLDVYTCDETIYCYINVEAEKVVYFRNDNINKAYYEEKNNAGATKHNEEVIKEKAITFLSQNVDCLSEYDLIKFYHHNDKECGLTYARFVNGIKTSDQIELKITPYGDICLLDTLNIGVIDENIVPTQEDMNIIMDGIDNLVSKMRDRGLPCYMYYIFDPLNDIEFRKLSSEEYALVIQMRFIPVDTGDEIDISQQRCRWLGDFTVYYNLSEYSE